MDEKTNYTPWILGGILVTLLILAFLLFFLPIWGVWSSEMGGKAELAQAEYSKKVAVETAKAKRDSASYEAEAEVLRAEGIAKANHIIGDSLKGKEEYLRYLYITNLESGQNREVIYIPTEAGIPILEANRFDQIPVQK